VKNPAHFLSDSSQISCSSSNKSSADTSKQAEKSGLTVGLGKVALRIRVGR
jgi:hypothetical protein